jgi:hypothetical protein
MDKKTVNDFYKDGRWFQRTNIGSKYTWTISGSRWNNLKDRTRPGALWNRIPAYIGSRNDFCNFDSFVEWSREQTGYSCENYNLDADILSDDEKVYSQNTCLFIPQQLNRFIQGRRISTSTGKQGITMPRENVILVRCHIDTGFQKETLLHKHLSLRDMKVAEELYIEAKRKAKNIWIKTLTEGKYIVDSRVIDYLNNMEFKYD